MSQTRFWTLTLNNYNDEDIERWDSLVSSNKADYLCYQEEVAPTSGTRHLQGYVIFPKVIRLTGVKKALGRAVHAVRSNGSPSANRTYCSKAGGTNFKEFGLFPDDSRKGKRYDLEEFKRAVEDGLRCRKKARLEFPHIVAKYPRWCYDLMSDFAEIHVEDHAYYDWQADLYNRISEPPDDRKVIFVVDKVGNTGKTWFAKHYVKTHDDAQYMEPSKKSDMTYALSDGLRVLFVNVTRTTDNSQSDYLYSFLESVKDGMVFSPKYESKTKYLGKVHVVVMMNSDPNMDLLSSDRYEIVSLKSI